MLLMAIPLHDRRVLTSVYFHKSYHQSVHPPGVINTQKYYHTILAKMDNNTKEIKISLTFVRHGQSEGNQGGLMQVPKQILSRFLS